MRNAGATMLALLGLLAGCTEQITLGKAQPSLVRVVYTYETGEALVPQDPIHGSGFVVDPRHVITASHVVSPRVTFDPHNRLGTEPQNETIELTLDGRTFEAIATRLPDRDLALLELSENLTAPALCWPRTDTPLGQGTDVRAFGFPRGKPDWVSRASFSRAGGPDGYPELKYLAKLEGHLTEGYSGGPVTDAHGRLVGIAAGGLPLEREGYFVPISDRKVRTWLDSERVPHCGFGAEATDWFTIGIPVTIGLLGLSWIGARKRTARKRDEKQQAEWEANRPLRALDAHRERRRRLFAADKQKYGADDSMFTTLKLVRRVVGGKLDDDTCKSLNEILKKYPSIRSLVVIGGPGSGKTTILHRLELESPAFCFFAELQRYDGTVTPIEWLRGQWEAQIETDLPSFDELKKVNAVLLLDGLNEMTCAPGDYASLVGKWSSFCKEHAEGNWRFVFSCRSHRNYQGLQFDNVEVMPLSKEQRADFLRRHTPEHADVLIQQIEMPETSELYSTPYFLKILVDHGNLDGQIPRDRAALFTTFLRNCFRVAYNRDAERIPVRAAGLIIDEQQVNTILNGRGVDQDPYLLPLQAHWLISPALECWAYEMQISNPVHGEHTGSVSQLSQPESEALLFLNNHLRTAPTPPSSAAAEPLLYFSNAANVVEFYPIKLDPSKPLEKK